MFNMTQQTSLAVIAHAREVQELWGVARMSLQLFGFWAMRDTNLQQIGNRLRPTRQTYIIPKTFLTLNHRLMMKTVTVDIHYDDECFLSSLNDRHSFIRHYL
jgi:hypothetical protein